MRIVLLFSFVLSACSHTAKLASEDPKFIELEVAKLHEQSFDDLAELYGTHKDMRNIASVEPEIKEVAPATQVAEALGVYATTKMSCTAYQIVNGKSKRVGKIAAGKRVWTEPGSGSFLKVQTKPTVTKASDSAYVSKNCF